MTIKSVELFRSPLSESDRQEGIKILHKNKLEEVYNKIARQLKALIDETHVYFLTKSYSDTTGHPKNDLEMNLSEAVEKWVVKNSIIIPKEQLEIKVEGDVIYNLIISDTIKSIIKGEISYSDLLGDRSPYGDHEQEPSKLDDYMLIHLVNQSLIKQFHEDAFNETN